MIFKQSMTKEFGKIESLSLIGQRISSLISGQGFMRRMPNLKELNLSNNKVASLG